MGSRISSRHCGGICNGNCDACTHRNRSGRRNHCGLTPIGRRYSNFRASQYATRGDSTLPSATSMDSNHCCSDQLMCICGSLLLFLPSTRCGEDYREAYRSDSREGGSARLSQGYSLHADNAKRESSDTGFAVSINSWCFQRSASNSGGINVQQATTGDSSPIINSPITVGDVPKRISAKDLVTITQYLEDAKCSHRKLPQPSQPTDMLSLAPL